MTLDDNLTGISMSAKKGVVEDTNAETIRFRKSIGSREIDASPPTVVQQTLALFLQKLPLPHPPLKTY